MKISAESDYVKTIRKELGLTQEQLGRALGLIGNNNGRTVRSWESGDKPVSGPVTLALKYLLQNAKKPL